MHRLQELVRLHRMDTGAREVARLLRMGPNTEREYRCALEAEDVLEGDPAELPELATLKAAVLKHKPEKSPPQQESSATPWLDQILEMVKKGATPKPLGLLETQAQGRLHRQLPGGETPVPQTEKSAGGQTGGCCHSC